MQAGSKESKINQKQHYLKSNSPLISLALTGFENPGCFKRTTPS